LKSHPDDSPYLLGIGDFLIVHVAAAKYEYCQVSEQQQD
jgi:hypothetical protein